MKDKNGDRGVARSRLSVCSGADAVKIFGRVGYKLDHQTGSHMVLYHPSKRCLTVPNHRELAKGTLRALVREAGLTKQQFSELSHRWTCADPSPVVEKRP